MGRRVVIVAGLWWLLAVRSKGPDGPAQDSEKRAASGHAQASDGLAPPALTAGARAAPTPRSVRVHVTSECGGGGVAGAGCGRGAARQVVPCRCGKVSDGDQPSIQNL